MVCESQNDKYGLISRFSGEMVRVITGNSHYRGECLMVNINSNDVFLKDVVSKVDSGWVNVSDFMLICGSSVESIYIELGYPFDVNESLILSVENGQINQNSEVEGNPELEGLL
ncbi:hypothetical protein [uncultured Methanomethylovorans sp.]|uniref:hypothetical protein n=1 Tax=uncultured Methanomethylovorans sp. TaxID=183759 RepID=UPI002AA7F126|nr:hypothetical protein [uncultured Methanomethylovorans sp.]